MASWVSHTLGGTTTGWNLGRDSITLHQSRRNVDVMMVNGRRIRRVTDADINYQRVLSSKILNVAVVPEAVSISSGLQVLKLKKTVQTAKVYGYEEKFTATTLEPVDEMDREVFQEIVKTVQQAALCHGSQMLTQLFAMTEPAETFTMLAHGELASGDEFVSQYRNKDWIVYHYLEYIHGVAIQTLRDDKTMKLPVTNRWGDWSIDLKTLACYYNPASLCFDPPTEEHLRPLNEHLHPLRQDTLTHLTATEVVARVEEDFGDFLCLIASGGGRWIGGLSNYAQNGLLTLGTVVDGNRPGILAHFASTPSPEYFCQSSSPDVKATYSGSDFVWPIFASPSTSAMAAVMYGILFILIELVFASKASFLKTMQLAQNLHTSFLFYWSSDPHGRNIIPKEHWERLGIPEMTVQGVIGSYWSDEEYLVIQEVLKWKKYNLTGVQYAYDHGYSKLIPDDPHDTAHIQELEYSDSEKEYNLNGVQYAHDHGYSELNPGDPHDTAQLQEQEYSNSDSEPM
ncbi:hypothetical protein PQX77_019969 [Marasmius sp. AFHP31]|nr:hypothetical protein PQX77_019969 [Marasmius sp. AFHP31]